MRGLIVGAFRGVRSDHRSGTTSVASRRIACTIEARRAGDVVV